MIYSFKIVILFCTFILGVGNFYAQKIDIKNYENKAQAYAILSAQYSKEAYSYSRENYFSTSIKAIKQNCDTGMFYAQIAIEYADSAVGIAHDTCVDAISVMLKAKENQLKTIKKFKQIKNSKNLNMMSEFLEESMYSIANAVVDAYQASLMLESSGMTNNDDRERSITRLESDEFSFMTIKELYGKRLVEIEDEILLLDEESKKSSGNKLVKINNAISQLKKEEKNLFTKMKSSEDKLISVKNDLSEEMMQIVNKDIFTTDKEGFYNENVPVPVNVELPKGLVYRVQIGFFKSQLPPEHFKGIFPLSSQKIDNIYYRYVAGNFAKYQEAKSAIIAISEKGYSDSFVVAYIDGKKVSISEALKEEKETN
jgi:hypothetical protein